jgi:effector-binding domain-containing protein
MIAPRVNETEQMTVAYLAMRGGYAQIPEGYARLYHWLEARGYVPKGMPRAVYFTDPAEVPEAEAVWELWAPVQTGPSPSGPDDQGLGVKAVAARRLATAVHKGPYDSVGATYGALAGWIAEQGYEIAGPPEEAYLTDPAEAPPEEHLTEIAFPVRVT